MTEVLGVLWLIGLTCILPILSIWFSMRKKINETNKRQEILMAALLLFPLLPSDMQIIESIVHLGRNITLPGNAKVLSTLMIVALSYGLVFSIDSVRRDIMRHNSPTNW